MADGLRAVNVNLLPLACTGPVQLLQGKS